MPTEILTPGPAFVYEQTLHTTPENLADAAKGEYHPQQFFELAERYEKARQDALFFMSEAHLRHLAAHNRSAGEKLDYFYDNAPTDPQAWAQAQGWADGCLQYFNYALKRREGTHTPKCEDPACYGRCKPDPTMTRSGEPIEDDPEFAHRRRTQRRYYY